MKNKTEKIDKIISLLQEWKNDVSMLGNETAYSDDILRLAKENLDNFIEEVDYEIRNHSC